MTRGEKGAVAYLQDERFVAPSPIVEVIDTVGAGDSFMSALIAAMDADGALGAGARAPTGADLEKWLAFSVAASAITCTRQRRRPADSRRGSGLARQSLSGRAVVDGLLRTRRDSDRGMRGFRKNESIDYGRPPTPRRRPPARLSPHLTIYRPTLTMAMSIMHRITGGALYVGVLLLAWFLLATSMDAAAFGVASGFLNSIIGRLILFGFTWALFHHMLGGDQAFHLGRRLRLGRPCSANGWRWER